MSTPTRTHRLRSLLYAARPTVIMEAHNGLSAKLVEEAGFEAVWASGLSISASLGVRDSNEASWTQVLEVVEFMADATDLPILLDGDTGFGNFNSVRRLVTKLEQRGVAGVCLEDKLFPKTNSLLEGGRQELVDPREFAGKIRAAKDTQRDGDFTVVARTEALIAGHGLQEALDRAEAYVEAGADAVVIHSRKKDAEEVFAFADRARLGVPLIAIPTRYPSVPGKDFTARGIHNLVFANHSMRTVITALQRNLHVLKESSDLMSLEDEIVPVAEIFRLQGTDELDVAEKKYLPKSEIEGGGSTATVSTASTSQAGVRGRS